MEEPNKISSRAHQPVKSARLTQPDHKEAAGDELRIEALARRLVNMDYSLDSGVKESLRDHLQSRSRWVAIWFRGLNYWTGFAVMIFIVMAWLVNLQFPSAIPGEVPQASAYASNGSTAHAAFPYIESTRPLAPKPIQTPLAVHLPDSQTMAPALTVSPYTTPNITHKTDFH